MAKNEDVEIKSDTIRGYQRISFSGSLMYGQTEKVREKVFSLLTGAKGYILDMRNVNLIDSTGFGILISLAKRLRHSQNRMVVVVNNTSILQLFTITKMQLIFPIVETEDAAIKLLSEELDSLPPRLSIDEY